MEDFKPNGFPTNWMIPKGAYVPIFEPRTATCSFSVIPVLAPDNAVSNETIMGVINNGTERILVQQFSTGRFWGEDANPFITALIDAARRGCEVKVLLDSNDYNLDAWNDNDEAIKWMNGVANEEHLNLEANLADLDALGLTKLHTKGLIVDGKVVVIASLNWNANSIYNREAGIIVENEELASYYEAVFFHDWNASVKRELAGYRENGSEERSATEKPLKIKVLGIAVTIILSFIIFRIVRWYKRT
jgi:phosphatidylserine/phosphatidylglycerophosphate/cardiolipin synthase-like enzyme